MAYDVSGMAAYSKSNGQILIADLILAGESFNQSAIGVQQGIKSSDKLVDFSVDGLTYVQKTSGDPGALSFSGGTTLLDVTISVTELAIKEKYTTNTLNSKITQLQMRAGSDPSNPLPYADVLVGLKKNAVGGLNDLGIWQGETSGSNTDYRTNLFDGFLKKIAAGSFISGATTGALASGTCIAQMNTFIELAHTHFPAWVVGGSYIWMNPTNFSVWYKAIFGLGGAINSLTLNTGNLPGSFIVPGTKVTVYSTQGLTGSNKKVMTREGNLVVGTDLVSEDDTLNLTYDAGSGVMSWVLFGCYKLGTSVARPQEVLVAA
jgi:hypothetical protein